SALLAHGEAALWFLAALFALALPPLLVPRLAFGAAAPARSPTRSAAPSPAPLSAHRPRGPPGSHPSAL
ncbi:copper resistance protein CopC, partial [Nocardiopsis tropica]|nr:copper resistance protein CopC [Nocardiopsis tropica]